MKKKFLLVLVLALVILTMTVTALAVEVNYDYLFDNQNQNSDIMLIDGYDKDGDYPATIRVQIDGEYLDFTDEQGYAVNPEMMNNRTMVPMRKIFEAFNATVEWDNDTKTVVATTDAKQITLTINNNVALIKDLATEEETTVELDAAPALLSNRTMVPVRVVAEGLEKEVGWDSTNRTVVIIDFDKVRTELEEKVPQLAELFEIDIEPVNTFKTTSKVSGKVVYKDKEEKDNNETLTFDGTLKLNVNQDRDMELYLNDLTFTGKGQIYTALKQAGYEKMSLAMVIKGGTSYLMMEQDGEEVWTELGNNVDVSFLSALDTSTTSLKSYDDAVELLKTAMGELSATSYEELEQLIDTLAVLYGEYNLHISGTSSKKTIKMDLDLKGLLAAMAGTSEDLFAETFGDSNITATLTEVVNKGKVESQKLTFEMYMEEPEEGNETIEITFELNMKYDSVNKDFTINAPNVK